MIFDVDRVPVPEHLIDDWVDEPEPRSSTCWPAARAVPHGNMLVVDHQSRQRCPGPTGREVSPTFKLKLAFWLDRAADSAPRSSAGWPPSRRPSIRPCSAPSS